jgi:hypothetical protein
VEKRNSSAVYANGREDLESYLSATSLPEIDQVYGKTLELQKEDLLFSPRLLPLSSPKENLGPKTQEF